MTPEWLIAILGIHIVGFWFFLFQFFRLRRQVRCLHFCYVGISDWGIDKLIEEREDYIRLHGEHVTPFTLLHVERDWKIKVDYLQGLQNKAGACLCGAQLSQARRRRVSPVASATLRKLKIATS